MVSFFPSSILRATFLAPLDTALALAPTALFRPDFSFDPILARSPGFLDPSSSVSDCKELVCDCEDEPPLPLSYPLENSLPTALAPLTAVPAT